MLIIPLLSVLFSCSPTRHLKEDEKLLTSVQIKSKKGSIKEDELLSLARQKPNRKILGLFRLHLGVYNLYYDKKDSKVKEKIGEAPVVYDSTQNDVSAKQMTKYMQNLGYYDCEVNWIHKLKGQKVKLKFTVDKGDLYRIDKFDYNINNSIIRAEFYSDSSSSQLHKNSAFSVELMKEERKRIERQMRDAGFYYFTKEFVVFEADTFHNSKKAEVTLTIKDEAKRDKNTDTMLVVPHMRYHINKVLVRTNFNPRENKQQKNHTQVDEIDFQDFSDYYLKKKVLSRLIFIRPGDFFNLRNQEETYSNLSSLQNFNLVNIQFQEDSSKSDNLLNVFIDVDSRKQKSYTIQTEGTNNGGNLGVNANISFQNNNTFKGAEVLSIRLKGGLEAQQLITEKHKDQGSNIFLPFNTYEFGPEISLDVPRFLLPFYSDKISPRGRPRTSFNASYNYQERPDYIRNVSKVFIAYSWNETSTKTHIIQPFDLSFIKLNPSPAFKEILDRINNPFLRNSYTDNLILALKYSFIYNTQSQSERKNNFFFRLNAESAGNLLSAITSNNDLLSNEDGTYSIFGIQYAQYLRSDLDFRFYQQFQNKQELVYRFSTGLGFPFGNSKAMPFEKSFYAGGANGIRAWRARELGPGSLADSLESTIDQIGNMKLEVNVEYRFPISGVFEGALFVDAGNIWNVSQDDSRPNTELSKENLWKGIAIGIGSGLRLNFSFFILRFDVAFPFKDPSKENPYKLALNWKKTNLNLGIGYPF